MKKKEILLFSTLSPYPFWAGSEKYWFDFATDPNVSALLTLHAVLGESPTTSERGHDLTQSGHRVTLFPHFNVNFARRNLYRVIDRVTSKRVRTLPWFAHIRSDNPDLVWFCVSTSHQILDVAYGAAICRELNIPYWVILQHSYEDFFLPENEERDLAASIARDARRFVFISHRNRFSFERAISEVLPNAFHSTNTLSPETMRVALTVPSVSAGEKVRFFNLGRSDLDSKGQHLIIEALAQERWRSRDWELTFVGFGEDGERYMGQIARYFKLASERLRFVPFTDSVIDEIGRHDLLLMPSLAEGTPYAMIESMACARPAVGTPVGGIPELIADGETGWLARTCHVSDVADALERAWIAKDTWHEAGARARAMIVRDHSQETAHAQLMEAIREDIS